MCIMTNAAFVHARNPMGKTNNGSPFCTFRLRSAPAGLGGWIRWLGLMAGLAGDYDTFTNVPVAFGMCACPNTTPI